MPVSRSSPITPISHHSGHDEVVAIPGVASVHDQESQARVDRDHFRRDDDEPCDAYRDPKPMINCGITAGYKTR